MSLSSMRSCKLSIKQTRRRTWTCWCGGSVRQFPITFGHRLWGTSFRATAEHPLHRLIDCVCVPICHEEGNFTTFSMCSGKNSARHSFRVHTLSALPVSRVFLSSVYYYSSTTIRHSQSTTVAGRYLISSLILFSGTEATKKTTKEGIANKNIVAQFWTYARSFGTKYRIVEGALCNRRRSKQRI